MRRTRESLSFADSDRGSVSVDVVEIYDAPAQVTRGTWHLSTDSEPDFVVAPLEIRSISPQELPLLVSLGGLRLVERLGDWYGRPFAADSLLQLCICESAWLKARALSRPGKIRRCPGSPQRRRSAGRGHGLSPLSISLTRGNARLGAEVPRHVVGDPDPALAVRGLKPADGDGDDGRGVRGPDEPG